MLLSLLAIILISAQLAVRSVGYSDECAAQKIAENARSYKGPEKPFWCLAGWATADRLTLALVVIGFMQTVVFYEQARRLRDTIDKMDEVSQGQTEDMARSIAEAAKAAEAMKSVAASIAAQVVTTTEMAETQKEFWHKQMRAYVSVRFHSAVYQNRATNTVFEPAMLMVNAGQTPAYNVRHIVAADILPISLPDTFVFPMPEKTQDGSAGTLGSQQVFQISAIVARFIDEDEVKNTKLWAGVPKMGLYVWGRVDYDDIAGVRHYTNFAQKILWRGDDVVFGYTTGRHNDAD